VGVVGVKNIYIYSFHKMKRSVADLEGSISRIENVLLEEYVRNVGAAKCCAMNYCQHFPRETTLLLG